MRKCYLVLLSVLLVALLALPVAATDSSGESGSEGTEELETVNISEESIQAIAYAVSADDISVGDTFTSDVGYELDDGTVIYLPSALCGLYDYWFGWYSYSANYTFAFYSQITTNGWYFSDFYGLSMSIASIDSLYINGSTWTVKTLYKGTATGSYSSSRFIYSNFDLTYSDGSVAQSANIVGIAESYYTISFDTGFDDYSIESQRSTDFVVPSGVAYEGYIFEGWYLDDTLTTAYTADYEFVADTTLYAKWTKRNVVSFVTGFDDLVIDDQYADEFVLPDPPTYDGYIFGGWYLDSDYSAAYTSDYGFSSDTVLYAKWDPVYTVSFVTGFDDLTVEDQTTDNLSIPTLSYDGYVFGGWFLDGDFSVSYSSSYIFTGDTTLYAKWVESGTMAFFASSVFSSFSTLFTAEPILYLLSLMGLALIIGILKSWFDARC